MTVNSVWIVCREYAGIAEAGGVKNVSCSLSEGLVRFSRSVLAFLPYYGCVSITATPLFSAELSVGENHVTVLFHEAELHGVHIILLDAPMYREKLGVYVYTDRDADRIPGAVKGKGHVDVDVMNIVLQKAVLCFAEHTGLYPDVLHCQDAHTAILPALIKNNAKWSEKFAGTRLIVTIHNAGPGYRQNISDIEAAKALTGLPEQVLEDAKLSNRIEPFLLAGEFGILSTVSPWYAEELTDSECNSFTDCLAEEFKRRRISITGITNGIDFHRYDPRNPSLSLLPYPFDPLVGDLKGKYLNRKMFLNLIAQRAHMSGLTVHGSLLSSRNAVYFVYQGRLAWQKGLDVFEASARKVIEVVPEARFIIMGQGDPVFEKAFISFSEKYSGQFLFISGYERSFARLAVAVSDFLVLPSLFEPCGLEDYIGQMYGTIPVAHAVGGLKKILNNISGFLYTSSKEKNDVDALADLLCSLARRVMQSGGEGCASDPQLLKVIENAAYYVLKNASWDSVIKDHYLPLYSDTL